MGTILIGTAAWSDHEALYPPGLRGTERIRHYARHFPVVEVNSSYYAILPQRNYETWADKTPDDFTFNVKALGLLTGHERGEQPAAEVFAAFRESYRPLREAGKLGAILFQYPPWFERNQANLDYIAHCADKMEDDLVLVEFRNRTWLADDVIAETLDFLRGIRACYVTVDEPQVGAGTVPPIPAVTNDQMGYMRLHGRNAESWYSAGGRAIDRHNYSYSDEELTELAQAARWLAERSDVVHVIFNNNVKGQGIANARAIMRMLGIDPPENVPLQASLNI